MNKIAKVILVFAAATASAGAQLIVGNLVANGDFSGGLTNWISATVSPSAGSASVTNGVLYYNVVADDGAITHLRFRQDGLPLTNGRIYRLTFDARAQANRTIRANVRSVSLGAYLNFDVALTTNMTSFTTNFTAALATVSDGQVNFYLGGAGVNDVWLDNVSLAEVDSGWFSAGDVITVQPQGGGGTLYLSKIRQPYAFYTNAAGAFDETNYAAYAAMSTNVVAGNIYNFDTGLLPEGSFNQVSGSYELLLVSNHMVQASYPFHLAFTDRPVSPDYEVSVKTSSQTVFTNIDTYFSYCQREYVKNNADWSIDSVNLFDPSHKKPIASHSFAGFSTADYPITVRVKVLGQAFAPNTYFDATTRFSYPLTSVRVIPSTYGISSTLIGNDTIEFTLDRPRKVLVVPNYEKGMDVFRNLAVGYIPIDSFETGKGDLPQNHPSVNITQKVAEGFKNPLMFFARTADTFPQDLGFAETDPGTLVIHPGDRPTQAQLSAASVVWFKPGVHDLSRLGDARSYKTYIEAGQTYYLEEGAFVAIGPKKRPQPGRPDDDPGGADCRLVGRGVITGINHFYGGIGGFWHGNGNAIEINVIDGITFTDRANYGLTGGDLIQDVANLGAWHGNNGGVDFIDHCTVRDCFLTAADDNLKVSDHTTAENLVIMPLTDNAHSIMVHEMVDDVTYTNTTIKNVDIIGTWQEMSSSTWKQLSQSAICCIQSRNIRIQDFTFSDIRIESPYVFRILSFFNLYKDTPQGQEDAYAASWFDVTTEPHHTHIEGLTLENITVNTPLLVAKSLIGSSWANSFTNVSFSNLVVNGVLVTETNKDTYFEISGYVLGSDPADGGSGRIDTPNPVQNLTFQGSFYSVWAHQYLLNQGSTGDDDGDGFKNLYEFAVGGNPTNASDHGYLPAFILKSAGGSNWYEFVYAQRSDPNSGLIYYLQLSDNLISNVWTNAGYTVVGSGPLTNGFLSVTNRIEMGTKSRQFIRLVIQTQ